MNSTNAVNILSLLLSQSSLRKRFRENAHQLLDELEVQPEDRAVIESIHPDQLDLQSNLLIEKRMKHVKDFVPVTFCSLGNKAEEIFSCYAESFWPVSYRRHFEDTLHFLNFLKKNGESYDSSECNRMTFLHSGKRLAISFLAKAMVRGHNRMVLQVQYRWRTRYRERYLFLGV